VKRYKVFGTFITKTGYETTIKEGKLDALSKKGFERIKRMKVDAPSPYFEHAKIQELIRSIFEEVSLGKTTPDKAADRIINETNKVLKTIQ
jgi:oligogalacturonide transport system substrate-binding protein